tara:strand:- start:3780 stop:5639 length:1860 start_codon:yes stop_codon:yes gene_type:complete
MNVIFWIFLISFFSNFLSFEVDAETLKPKHGLSVFGDLKYSKKFQHFDYVNPKAPKGGKIRLPGLDNFESINPFILKGRKEPLAEHLMFDTLMTRAFDEPDSYYALVAKSVEIPANRGWVAFNIDKRAQFHDGTPITSEDVVFTFNILIKDGHPSYRAIYRDVASVKPTSRYRVLFTFKSNGHRDLPTRLATLPVLSKQYYSKVKFNKTSYIPPLTSGPYTISKLIPGRSITYQRFKKYWAKDLPTVRGRFNFDQINVQYYRDREVAFQAFFSQQYDFREEFTSRQWATQYDKPAVNRGFIVKEVIPDQTPSGVQAFILNLRRKKFQDIRVRTALDLAFDFEWTNKTLFYGLYKRTNSMFENSTLAARHPPSKAEIKLLKQFEKTIPLEVFKRPFQAPVTDGTGNIRTNLRNAKKLLKRARYLVKNNKLYGPDGKTLTIEFLLFESSFKRVLNPFIKNLQRLGIKSSIRIVDIANFKRRQDNFDFDIVIRRIVQPITPGLEQRNYFSSTFANQKGTLNVGGIKNPVIDSLLELVVSAKTRASLVTAVKALDRVIMWNRYVIPQWYKGSHNIAYWNKFGRPQIIAKYNLGVIDTWWLDKKKSHMLNQNQKPPKPVPLKIN